MTLHPADETLLRLFTDSKADPSVAEHVQGCSECRDRLDDVLFGALLNDGETWRLADELTDGSERLGENLRNAQLSADEDAEAEERLRPYLRNPARFGWTTFLRSREHRTAGTVRVLCRAANERCEQKPLEARILAESAVAIAEALPQNHYLGLGIHLLRGLAWKERGNARHAMGDFPSALDSFNRAMREYSRVESAALDQAIVNYCRGRAFSQSERFAEALAVLALSEETFVAYGDTSRYVNCRLEVANTLFRRGETAEAIRIWEALGAHAEASDDLLLLSRVSNNLGFARIAFGAHTDALAAFQRALEGFVHLGKETQAVRSRWGLARVVVEMGDFSRGASALQDSLHECEHFGMVDDAMLVSLDLADALLRAGQTAESYRLCKSLVRYFRRAGLQTAALRAFSYLREAALRKALTRGAISSVREFVERVITNPALRFVPPPLA